MGWEAFVLPTNIKNQESSEADENLCTDISGQNRIALDR